MLITGTTHLTGLLGSPVEHSISPLIHNFSFQELKIDCAYLCFDIAEGDLKEAVNALRLFQVRGFNLTMPNKTRILEYLDALTPAARLIGAVNTVENKNGYLTGHNTDGLGFMRSVREQGISVKGENITLMGIGGAASAICAQAALDGTDTIHIFARLSSSHLPSMTSLVQNLTKETSSHIFLHDMKDTEALKTCMNKSRLLVNATSVGMAPHTQDCLIPDLSYFHPGLAVADVIYNPWKTRLLSMAEEAGCTCFNGYGMLLYQGAEAFRIWTGRDMPVEKVRAFLRSQTGHSDS